MVRVINGKTMGGKPFNKATLYNLLTNVAYVGQIKHKDVVYDGEHDAVAGAALPHHCFPLGEELLDLSRRQARI